MVRLAHYDALHYAVLFLDHEMVYLANSKNENIPNFGKQIFLHLYLASTHWVWEARAVLEMLEDTLWFRQAGRSWGTGTSRGRPRPPGRGSSLACCRSASTGGRPPRRRLQAEKLVSGQGLPPSHEAGASTSHSPGPSLNLSSDQGARGLSIDGGGRERRWEGVLADTRPLSLCFQVGRVHVREESLVHGRRPPQKPEQLGSDTIKVGEG